MLKGKFVKRDGVYQLQYWKHEDMLSHIVESGPVYKKFETEKELLNFAKSMNILLENKYV